MTPPKDGPEVATPHSCWTWDNIIEKVADIPWGIAAFLIIIALMISGVLKGAGMDDAKALLTTAGLLGVGHGIHTGSKHLRR